MRTALEPAPLNRIHSCSPLLREASVELARMVDIDGRGSRGQVAFERPIGWLRDFTAEVRFTHGDRSIRTMATLCDVRTWLDCIASARDRAVDLCAEYRVDAASTLAVEVAMSARDIPVLADSGRRMGGRLSWEPVPSDWMLMDAAPGDAPRVGARPLLRDMEVLGGFVVWSSGWDGAASVDAEARLRRTWAHP